MVLAWERIVVKITPHAVIADKLRKGTPNVMNCVGRPLDDATRGNPPNVYVFPESPGPTIRKHQKI